ncbi:MAG: phage tail sheath family protein, partial [Anaerotignaceae bacterium]
MAEYLTPGVYVEEFDSGEPPLTNVSTSTVGFVGVTEKGPQFGVPVLVTNFASFRRIFGGYLSESEFGDYRYLAYAVSQFFTNGGSRCYIKRVVPNNATYSYNTEDASTAPLVVYAKDPGNWGNKITINTKPSSKAKTQVLEKVETANQIKYRVKNAQGFIAGDIVCSIEGDAKVYNKITSVDENMITFEEEFKNNIVDTSLIP